MNFTIHIDRVTVVDNGQLDQILTIVKQLEIQMSQIQDLINDLNATVAADTNAERAALTQISALQAHIDDLLAKAAAAPSLEETNALIKATQDAMATIKDNNAALVGAALANTPAEPAPAPVPAA